MNSLIERLRQRGAPDGPFTGVLGERTRAMLLEAADTIEAQSLQVAALRAFVRDLFELNDWPEGGDVDGFDLQELLVKHGILIEQTVTEPCNVGREEAVNCSCAEFGDFPQTCYRKQPWAIDAALSTATQEGTAG